MGTEVFRMVVIGIVGYSVWAIVHVLFLIAGLGIIWNIIALICCGIWSGWSLSAKLAAYDLDKQAADIAP